MTENEVNASYAQRCLKWQAFDKGMLSRGEKLITSWFYLERSSSIYRRAVSKKWYSYGRESTVSISCFLQLVWCSLSVICQCQSRCYTQRKTIATDIDTLVLRHKHSRKVLTSEARILTNTYAVDLLWMLADGRNFISFNDCDCYTNRSRNHSSMDASCSGNTQVNSLSLSVHHTNLLHIIRTTVTQVENGDDRCERQDWFVEWSWLFHWERWWIFCLITGSIQEYPTDRLFVIEAYSAKMFTISDEGVESNNNWPRFRISKRIFVTNSGTSASFRLICPFISFSVPPTVVRAVGEHFEMILLQFFFAVLIFRYRSNSYLVYPSLSTR